MDQQQPAHADGRRIVAPHAHRAILGVSLLVCVVPHTLTVSCAQPNTEATPRPRNCGQKEARVDKIVVYVCVCCPVCGVQCSAS